MSQGAIVNPNRAIPRFRLNNVTPFTYRDGLTYLQVIEEIKDKLVEVIDSHNEWGDAVDDLITELDNHMSELKTELDNHTSGLKTELVDESGAALDTITSLVAQSAESLNDLLVELTGQLISVGNDSQASMLSILSDAEDVLSNVMEISGLTGEDGAVAQLLNMVSTATHNAALSVAHLGSIRRTTVDDNNFDNLVTGIYYVPLGAHATALGLPVADHGLLIVSNYGNAGAAYYFPRDLGSPIYRRSRSSATWGPWRDSPEWSRGSLGERNLDILMAPGTYWQSTPTRATVARGYPAERAIGVLVVEQAASDVVVQRFTQIGLDGWVATLVRTVSSSGAGEWEVESGGSTPIRRITPEDDDFSALDPGMYYVALGAYASALGLPVADHGFLTVHHYGPNAGGAWYLPRTADGLWKRAKNDGEWGPWENIIPEPSQTVTMDAALRHQHIVTRHAARIGAPIDVGTATPIAFVWDDYPVAMRDKGVVAAAQQHGVPINMALCARTLTDRAEKLGGVGITWAEIDAWVADGTVEITNHGQTHDYRVDDLYAEIVTGLEELRGHCPSAEITTWVNPANDWDGFSNGQTADNWASPAGQLIHAHHVYAMGRDHILGDDHSVPMTGTPIPGQGRMWVEAVGMTMAARKKLITDLYGTGRGAVLSAHADWIGEEGRWTAAGVAEFFEWLRAEEDAGRVKLMHLSRWPWAKSTVS